jgi:hypothetical protein
MEHHVVVGYADYGKYKLTVFADRIEVFADMAAFKTLSPVVEEMQNT